MVTVRVVSGLAEQNVAGPRAAGTAFVRVVAGAAEAPKVLDRAIARVPQRSGAFPDVAQGMLAHRPSCPALGRQGRATLDRSVCLDADRRAPGAARVHVAARHVPAQRRLEGTEVAHVVSRKKADAGFVAAC